MNSLFNLSECSRQVEMGQSAPTATRPVSHLEDAAAGSHSGVLTKKTAVETMFAASVNCFPEAQGESEL